VARVHVVSRVLTLGLALSTLLVGCAPAAGRQSPAENSDSSARPAAKKRVAVAIRGDPWTLNASINSAGSGGVAGVSEIEEMVHAGLADIAIRRVAVAPRLAEAVPTTDNGLWRVFPDGRMETTWKIRSNARWHDGTPFTTEDLLFTAQAGQDRDLIALSHRGYGFVDSIDAADAQTLTVKWKRPFIEADTMFSGGFGIPLPKHLLERIYLEDKANFDQQPYWTRDFVGLGPYRVRDFVAGSHAVLSSFEGYTLGRPKIDEVEVRFILDPNTIIANVLAGTVDVTLGRGLSFEQGAQARDQWREGKMDLSMDATSWIALFPQFVNPSPRVIADVNFRRALLHATDRQALVDTFLGGLMPVAHSYVSPAQPEYRAIESSIVRYDYDPRRAAQLIEGLGYAKGPDGIYRDAANERLSVEIRTTAGDDLRDKMLFSLANEWPKLGIAVDPVIIPRQRAEDREYRAARPAFEMVRQPNDLSEGALQRLTSSEAALPENNFRGQNRVRYMNPEYDALVDRYLATIPTNDRLAVVSQLVRHISEQVPILGLLYDAQPMLVATRLVNVDADTKGRNAHDWDVK
jgi:peptide/nickel transport system substrate-binding protein